jgi:hypothetical protein
VRTIPLSDFRVVRSAPGCTKSRRLRRGAGGKKLFRADGIAAVFMVVSRSVNTV